MADETGTVKNEEAAGIAANALTMLDIYENILKFKLDSSSGAGDSETINILNNFRWTLNKTSSSGSSGSGKVGAGGQVPFAYVKEYRQIYSSQITNMINSLLSLENINTDALLNGAAEIA